MTEVRKLNPEGKERFTAYIESLLEYPEALPPVELLTDPSTSSTLKEKVEIEEE